MNYFRNELSWLLYHDHHEAPQRGAASKKQVQALRHAVQQGKYRVPAQVVAEHFLAEQLLFQEHGDACGAHAGWSRHRPVPWQDDADQ